MSFSISCWLGALRFTPEEEEIGVELRSRLALSLDDALEVMRRCLRPDISRAGLYRLWRRHGVAAAPPVNANPGVNQPFAPAPFGYVQADLKHLTASTGARLMCSSSSNGQPALSTSNCSKTVAPIPSPPPSTAFSTPSDIPSTPC
jgi:hypothetical protein